MSSLRFIPVARLKGAVNKVVLHHSLQSSAATTNGLPLRFVALASLKNKHQPAVDALAGALEAETVQRNVAIVQADVQVGRQPPVQARRPDVDFAAVLNWKNVWPPGC